MKGKKCFRYHNCTRIWMAIEVERNKGGKKFANNKKKWNKIKKHLGLSFEQQKFVTLRAITKQPTAKYYLNWTVI